MTKDIAKIKEIKKELDLFKDNRGLDGHFLDEREKIREIQKERDKQKVDTTKLENLKQENDRIKNEKTP